MKIQSGYKASNSFKGKTRLIIGKNMEESLAKEISNNTFLKKLSEKHTVRVSYDLSKDVFPVETHSLNNGLRYVNEHKVTIDVDGRKYNLINKDYDMSDNALCALRKNLRNLNNTTVDIDTGTYREKSLSNFIPISLKKAVKKTLKAIKQFFYIEHKSHKKY